MTSIQAITYPIHFESNGYSKLSEYINLNNFSSIFILVDENTLTHCYPKFIQHLAINNRIEVIEIESGEEHKNLETCFGVWGAMTDLDADRKSLLITLGGGVITDLGGFVASTFKRGIKFVNIPTTLLAMVDASVGGKTGVDLGTLKNQIGLFSNPEMVVVDAEYLQTLEVKEVRSGTAEIIKYGLIYDLHLYNEITTNKSLNIVDLTHRCIEIKNEVVSKDPKENGLRKILNFGHTIGHAIESYFLESSAKEKLTHGEAIAAGIICAAYISSKLLDFSTEKTQDIKQSIITIFGKIDITKNDFTNILALLKHDKKNVNGVLNFVLLNAKENPKIDCKVSTDMIIDSLSFYTNEQAFN